MHEKKYGSLVVPALDEGDEEKLLNFYGNKAWSFISRVKNSDGRVRLVRGTDQQRKIIEEYVKQAGVTYESKYL